jgi:hypothetical protein
VVQPTLQSAEFAGGKVTASAVLPDFLQDRPYLADGDGTVPQVSATPLQMNDLDTLAIADYIPESHGAIQGQPDVLLNLLKGLQRVETASTQDARGAIEGVARGTRSALKGIGLTLDDAYLPGEAIAMRAKVTGEESFNVLTAEITSVSPEGTSFTAHFAPDNGEWSLTTDPLLAGQYRVKVQTDRGDFTPVHNLFEVVALGE